MNIEDVEVGLEEIRQEERIIGTSLQQTKDDDLFKIDTTGDDKVRHILPKVSFSQLTSAKILQQRSAVPAVLSRPSISTTKRKYATVTQQEKERLLKIAKRPRKGPFNSIMDPSEYQSGSTAVGLSTAAKESGKYDVWGEEDNSDANESEDVEMLEVKEKKEKKRAIPKSIRSLIEVPAVAAPHEGTSYNPPMQAYTELLLEAHQQEEKRVQEAERLAEVKRRMENASVELDIERQEAENSGVAVGMKLDVPGDEEEDNKEEDGEGGTPLEKKKVPKRKTTAQKKKKVALLAEKREMAEKAANKKRMVMFASIKSLKKTTNKVLAEREQAQLARLQLKQEKLKKGLAGQKLGKHKVPEGLVDVQLGDDLTESLRELKPEGNLFRDRFISLQQRAIIEPRVRVLPRKRKTRIVEYEKHAYKRFDREQM